MWSALEHAAARVCGFVRCHRTLVVTTSVAAVCVGGAYYGYRRLVGAAEQFTQQLQRQMAEHQRLQLALASTTEESNATIQRFLPRLKKTLYARVDLERVVQRLKALDKTDKRARNALWEEAKTTAIVRYFTALLAFALWHMLVFAQVAIIGKRTFEKSRDKDAASSSSAPSAAAPALTRPEQDQHAAVAAQHEFLASGLEYFLTEGIARIQDHVERVVASNEQLQSWDVSCKLKVERDELNELLQSLYLSMLPPQQSAAAGTAGEERIHALWRSFLIYPEKKPGQSEHVISLLNDLWDLIESDLFGPALQHSLGFLCGNAFQDLNEVVYGVANRFEIVDEMTRSANGDSNSSIAPHQKKPSPPLAKLIPALQTEVNKLLTNAGQDSYLVKYSQGVCEMEAFRGFYEAIFFEQDAGDVGPQLI